MFQTFTVLSTLPDTKILSNESKAKQVTASSWPISVNKGFSLANSQIMIVLSWLPEMHFFVFEVNKT